jgi:alkylation response protein AidB-like acyl-CoA dehydrogenase
VRSLIPTAEQQILVQTARRFCAQWLVDSGERIERRFDRAAWDALADLGIFEIQSSHDVAVLLDELGWNGFVGPLVQTFTAASLLPPDERQGVLAGRVVVTIAGASPRVPWAPVANLFIELRDGRAYLASAKGPIEPLRTLSGEPWGLVQLLLGADLGDAAAAIATGNIAVAAYIAGAARRMVELAAEYAGHRRQFGHPIGDFQAVAHPLAEAWSRTTAARNLARFAALHLDTAGPDGSALAAAARLSAVAAARRASYCGHQVLGAMGYVEGTLLAALSRIVAQASLLPPGGSAQRAYLMAAMPGLSRPGGQSHPASNRDG